MLLGLAIMVGPFVLLLFLAVGPPGWLLLGAVVFLAGVVVRSREAPESGVVVTGVNCPDCGARNDADSGECHYCGTALGGAGGVEAS